MSQPGKTVMTLALAVSALLIAGTAVADSPVAPAEVGAARIAWQPATNGPLELTVSGPDGFYLRQTFAAGAEVTFSAFNEDGSLRPDGAYAFELKASATLDEKTRQDLAEARERGDAGAIARKAMLPRAPETSGYFSILDGAIEMGGKPEDSPASGSAGLAPKGTVLTSADGIIYNSLCVGFDCPTSPTFSDTTILMMENNTRIKFDDTSAVNSFPRNDWEIEANSSVNGGASYLGFNDCGQSSQGGCATDLVFAVEAGARQNALYVESDGDVGIGTSNPVVRLHAVDGDTPTLRLEQDGSSGFAPQSWDVAGNETSFFVRDATNGSTLPFRIRPGAGSNALVIDTDDDIGIGTLTAEERLHIKGSDNPRVLIEDTTDNANDKPGLALRSPAAASGGDWRFEVDNAGNFQIDFGPSAGPELIISDSTATNGTVTVSGNLVVNGTCTGCDLVFQPGFELESIEDHADQMWRNSYLPAVGPTPEGKTSIDVFEKTTGMLQELEKAHIYIEQLHSTVEGLEAELAKKDRAIDDLEARMARLEKAAGKED